MRAINIEAAQHRQGSACKVLNEGLSGSSDWLNPRQEPRTSELTVLEGSNQLISNYGFSQ
jgi:hypothetical protein